MSILEFRKKVNLIKVFVRKIDRESLSIKSKKILIRIYANNLRINLTDKMIVELIIN
ncbi:hypothetical protein [Clostridium ganghwense]|uniref:Integrase n=1 Tax=Clostridium ganghwense TaxID=312089 RepID=A0ABT4CNF5_9CLOT|nr:hypothetical protein [Clostridium ganghwense]MCY6369746.1 hypothetical protein [Clostridium ganghwense]